MTVSFNYYLRRYNIKLYGGIKTKYGVTAHMLMRVWLLEKVMQGRGQSIATCNGPGFQAQYTYPPSIACLCMS